MSYQRNSIGYPYIFDHARLTGDIVTLPTLPDVGRLPEFKMVDCNVLPVNSAPFRTQKVGRHRAM